MAEKVPVVFELIADAEKAIASLRRFATSGDDALKRVKASTEGASKAGSYFETVFQGAASTFTGMFAAQAVMNTLTGVVRRLTAEIRASIAESNAQELATVRLNAALRSSGQMSEENTKRLHELADAYQRAYHAADEQLMEGMSSLIMVGKVHVDQMDRATQAALDLSAGLGMDLGTAFMLLSRAAAGNTTMLARYGVQIEKTGDRAKDFEQVLRFVEQRMGGQAAARATSFQGTMEGVGIAMSELREKIGDVAKGGLGELYAAFTKILERAGDWVERNKGDLIPAAQALGGALKDLLGLMWDLAQVFLGASDRSREAGGGVREFRLALEGLRDTVRAVREAVERSMHAFQAVLAFARGDVYGLRDAIAQMAEESLGSGPAAAVAAAGINDVRVAGEQAAAAVRVLSGEIPTLGTELEQLGETASTALADRMKESIALLEIALKDLKLTPIVDQIRDLNLKSEELFAVFSSGLVTTDDSIAAYLKLEAEYIKLNLQVPPFLVGLKEIARLHQAAAGEARNQASAEDALTQSLSGAEKALADYEGAVKAGTATKATEMQAIKAVMEAVGDTSGKYLELEDRLRAIKTQHREAAGSARDLAKSEHEVADAAEEAGRAGLKAGGAIAAGMQKALSAADALIVGMRALHEATMKGIPLQAAFPGIFPTMGGGAGGGGIGGGAAGPIYAGGGGAGAGGGGGGGGVEEGFDITAYLEDIQKAAAPLIFGGGETYANRAESLAAGGDVAGLRKLASEIAGQAQRAISSSTGGLVSSGMFRELAQQIGEMARAIQESQAEAVRAAQAQERAADDLSGSASDMSGAARASITDFNTSARKMSAAAEAVEQAAKASDPRASRLERVSAERASSTLPGVMRSRSTRGAAGSSSRSRIF